MMHDGWGAMGGSWAMLVFGILVLVPTWRICTRVGHSGWLSLLVLVPIANLFFLYFLAFSQWPIERARSVGPSGDRSS
jgi:uncharacterized membrane protein YhaH (DUF805 family)